MDDIQVLALAQFPRPLAVRVAVTVVDTEGMGMGTRRAVGSEDEMDGPGMDWPAFQRS